MVFLTLNGGLDGDGLDKIAAQVYHYSIVVEEGTHLLSVN